MSETIKLWGGPLHGQTRVIPAESKVFRHRYYEHAIQLSFLVEDDDEDAARGWIERAYDYRPYSVGVDQVIWTCSPNDADKFRYELKTLKSYVR